MPGIWRYRELLRNLVYKEMKLTYCASFLGLMWAMLIPFAKIAVLWAVFGLIFQRQMDDFVIYLVTGVLPWDLFSTSVMLSANAVYGNGNLLKKIYFPRLILPVSTVAYQLIMFGMAFVVFLIIYFIIMESFSWTLLLYPVALVLFVTFLLGVTFVVSAVTVFYKDVQQIVEISVYALFWMTPIVYSMDQITGKLRTIILLNPVSHYMKLFHHIVYWGTTPPMTAWGICCLFSACSLCLGVYCFKSLEQRFVEEL